MIAACSGSIGNLRFHVCFLGLYLFRTQIHSLEGWLHYSNWRMFLITVLRAFCFLSLSSSHEMVKAECGICAICSFKEMTEASSKLFIAILAMRTFPSETHSVSL